MNVVKYREQGKMTGLLLEREYQNLRMEVYRDGKEGRVLAGHGSQTNPSFQNATLTL